MFFLIVNSVSADRNPQAWHGSHHLLAGPDRGQATQWKHVVRKAAHFGQRQ
jgi:hypothetical protein